MESALQKGGNAPATFRNPLPRAAGFSPRGFARTLLAAATVVMLSDTSVGFAQEPTASSVPAEELRLDRAAFREGLKKRGLADLLELHLWEFPPTGEAEAVLMKRDLMLAVFADPDRSDDEREAAIAEGNRLLEKLIENHPHNPRRFQWQFDLAHSLLYDEAERLITSILYRGGSDADHRKLLALTTRAARALTSLTAGLALEYDRLDKLPLRRFEQLERSGYVEKIDRLEPKADYLLLWVLLYDCLARDDVDHTCVGQLNHIRAHLADNPVVLETAHVLSHIQVQAYVLAGMTERLLNDHARARQYFTRALAIADSLGDPVERERVHWAVTLAAVERIRNDRDDGRFEEAFDELVRFRQQLVAKERGNFGLRLIAALLERSIHRARADAADSAGRSADAKRHRNQAWRVLEHVAQHAPQRRDEIYATLCAVIGLNADVTRLDPFEQCALIAGLLVDADEGAEKKDPRLARAVEVGEHFLSQAGDQARSLVPEVLYNTAVAQYRRGRLVDAAHRFLEVARDHSTWENAPQAAVYAVQLTADMYADPSLREHPELQRLYRDALDTLVTRYDESDAARYWRFFYAQLLDELGEYDAAAEQYALVHREHEHYIEAFFSRVRCLALALQDLARGSEVDLLALTQRAEDFFAVQRDFLSQGSSELIRTSQPKRVATLKSLLARAKLLGAELQVLSQINRPAQALESLAEFETACAEEPALTGRVWRVRLMAYERLGRLDEAARTIPAYVAADPENAGPTLQSLCSAMATDVKALRMEGDERAARRKAEVALLLAEQIVEWAARFHNGGVLEKPRGLTVQLAEANLEVGNHQRARELFERCLAVTNVSTSPEHPTDLRVVFGYAEACFQLGDWAGALARFNTLAVTLPPTDPVRFKSLLRDLQCRTALNHPPRGIIKVIEQQRYLHPELGGPTFAREFEKLQRENQRRLDGR